MMTNDDKDDADDADDADDTDDTDDTDDADDADDADDTVVALWLVFGECSSISHLFSSTGLALSAIRHTLWHM